MLYLGSLENHWGHFLTEYTSRLWPKIYHPELDKISGFYSHIAEVGTPFREFLSVFNLHIGQNLHTAKGPTRIRKCLLPTASFCARALAYSVHREVFLAVAGKILQKTSLLHTEQPVFLSRAQLTQGRVLNGQEELESSLRRNGFLIVSPEKLSLNEQIVLFNTHRNIVGCWGSAFHNIAFVRDGSQLVTDTICDDRQYVNYYMFDALCGNRANYVISLRNTPGMKQVWPNLHCEVEGDKIIEYLKASSHLGEYFAGQDSISSGKLSGLATSVDAVRQPEPAPLPGEDVKPKVRDMIQSPSENRVDQSNLAARQLRRELKDGLERVTALQGVPYLQFLGALHRIRRVERYLEIGTHSGLSLAQATGRSIAIDPMFQLDKEVWSKKPGVDLFEMTSDDFFASHDPEEILGGNIDLALIDGMHLSEFVLRDFVNVERFCSANGVIVLHNSVPRNFEMSERVRRPERRRDKELAAGWTGDVWRVIPLLRRERPELRIDVFDCPPTGIALVSNLQPESHKLADKLPSLVSELIERDAGEEELWTFLEALPIVDSRALIKAGAL